MICLFLTSILKGRIQNKRGKMITKQEVCNYCKSMLNNNIVECPQMVESVLLPVYTSLLLCLRRRLAVILGLATIYDCQFKHLPRYVVGLGFLGGWDCL